MYPAGTAPYLAAGGEKIHPTQLYETLVCVALYFVLRAVGRRKKGPGEVMFLSGIGYGIWRFIVEFMRADERPKWMGLTYSQWVSLGAIVLCLVGFLKARSKGSPVAEARVGVPSTPV
jgi:phosphatidylglycerol:prolipoprotein diacylglycerol transferase